MNFVKFASASDDVKIWDSENCVLSDTVTPYSGQVSSVSWSPDGQFLVSCPKNDGRPVISVFKPKLETSFELPPDMQHSYACFGNTTNRYIAACGKSSDVLIWDAKTRRTKKSLKTNIDGRLNCAVFNTSDTHVACGGEDGSIGLVNCTSNLAYEAISAPGVKSILAMKFNQTCRTLLGTSSDDGSCCLWDCQGWKLLHCFLHAHAAPATDIALSPINDTFMTTVGLDSNLVTYDSRTKKILRTKKTDQPLTAIDFTGDGCHLLVGDYIGGIAIYDLRSFNAGPVKYYSAHRSPVNALAVLNEVVVSKIDMSINNALNKRTLPTSLRASLDKNCNADAGDKKIAPKAGKRPPPPPSKKVDLQTPTSLLPRMRSAAIADQPDSSLKVTNVFDVLSPLGSNNDPGTNACDNLVDSFAGSKIQKQEMFSPPTVSPVLVPRSPSSSPNRIRKSSTTGCSNSVPSFKYTVQPSSPGKAHSFGFGATRQPTARPPPSSPSPAKPVPPNKPAKNESRDVELSAGVDNSFTSKNGLPPKVSSSEPTAHNFPVTLLQNVISDIAEKVSDQNHADAISLHVKMVQLNQRLQDQIDKLAEKMAVNDELIKEVCRLNEENRRLRFRF